MNILEEALQATSKDRPNDYGHPRDHFGRTVAMLNAHFAHKLKEPFTVNEWPIIMIIDKLARLAGPGKNRDNLVDIAGYARTKEMVEETPTQKASPPKAVGASSVSFPSSYLLIKPGETRDQSLSP